jgi:hypothetical protein
MGKVEMLIDAWVNVMFLPMCGTGYQKPEHFDILHTMDY